MANSDSTSESGLGKAPRMRMLLLEQASKIFFTLLWCRVPSSSIGQWMVAGALPRSRRVKASRNLQRIR
ncbi:hypothetical protein D3C85_1853220 [compost metagenome]